MKNDQVVYLNILGIQEYLQVTRTLTEETGLNVSQIRQRHSKLLAKIINGDYSTPVLIPLPWINTKEWKKKLKDSTISYTPSLNMINDLLTTIEKAQKGQPRWVVVEGVDMFVIVDQQTGQLYREDNIVRWFGSREKAKAKADELMGVGERLKQAQRIGSELKDEILERVDTNVKIVGYRAENAKLRGLLEKIFRDNMESESNEETGDATYCLKCGVVNDHKEWCYVGEIQEFLND